MATQEQHCFESHCAWVASLRAQYDAMGEASPHECPDPPLVFLQEQFNDALDFDSEPPMYRSMTGSTSSTGSTDSTISWQPVCDEIDFAEPVFRSLGAAATDIAATMLDRAAWMQSLPPLVHRQRAFGQFSA